MSWIFLGITKPTLSGGKHTIKTRKCPSKSRDASLHAPRASLKHASTKCHSIFFPKFNMKKHLQTKPIDLFQFQQLNDLFGSAFLDLCSGNLKTCHLCMLVNFKSAFMELSNMFFNKIILCMIKFYYHFIFKTLTKNPSILK